MVWPIIWGESYVGETGKSMKAGEVAAISKELMPKHQLQKPIDCEP
jgi:hypothetical protein